MLLDESVVANLSAFARGDGQCCVNIACNQVTQERLASGGGVFKMRKATINLCVCLDHFD